MMLLHPILVRSGHTFVPQNSAPTTRHCTDPSHGPIETCCCCRRRRRLLALRSSGPCRMGHRLRQPKADPPVPCAVVAASCCRCRSCPSLSLITRLPTSLSPPLSSFSRTTHAPPPPKGARPLSLSSAARFRPSSSLPCPPTTAFLFLSLPSSLCLSLPTFPSTTTHCSRPLSFTPTVLGRRPTPHRPLP